MSYMVAGRREMMIVIGAASLLAIVGAALILAAAQTPWHTDSRAYFTELNQIRADLYGPPGSDSAEMADFNAASERFHALQDQYRTAKWAYADWGYGAVAWAVLLAVFGMVRSSGMGHGAPRLRMISATAAFATLVTVGVIAAAEQAFGRYQVPEWADSLAIPLSAAIGLAPIVLLVGLIAASVVLIRGTSADKLLLWPRPYWRTAVISVLYLPLLALATWLIGLTPQTGGWAVGPAGFLLGWMTLESRAVALTPNGKAGRNPVPNLSDP